MLRIALPGQYYDAGCTRPVAFSPGGMFKGLQPNDASKKFLPIIRNQVLAYG